MSSLHKLATILIVASASLIPAQAQTPRPNAPWQAKLRQELPLLGHRNWILIVDSAYPLQTAPGVETIETNATLPEVTQTVLHDLDQSIHVRPNIFMDQELAFLNEQDTPGVTRYRREIQAALGRRSVTTLLHEKLIGRVDEAGKVFHILILKTNLTIPYTSVFLQLDCKYLDADTEAKLRKAMQQSTK